ncbi:CheY-like superfamily [Aspergillus cavernicola]|uniref:CheY-like superfamily n=1 Tax=Aspergillus cavernicola TaxID=176166 RepID=A0ABR4HHB8_9EURO
MHILIAEDNCVNQRLLERFLQRIGGCTVTIVGNGQQALTYLSSPPATCPRPDIIFMDISMPIMGGFEATNIIRTQPPFTTDPKIPFTPIIAMTASQMRDESALLVGRGFDDSMTKPVRSSTLRKLILFWSRGFVAPTIRQGPGQLGVVVPRTGNFLPLPPAAQWGPFPLRPFSGPRSLL